MTARTAISPDRTFWSGGGGLVSTVGDYYRFCQMLLDGGSLDGRRIIGSRTLAVHDPQPPARRGGYVAICHRRFQ